LLLAFGFGAADASFSPIPLYAGRRSLSVTSPLCRLYFTLRGQLAALGLRCVMMGFKIEMPDTLLPMLSAQHFISIGDAILPALAGADGLTPIFT